MKKKILIIGGSSLISVNIAFFFRKKFDLYLACNKKKPKIKDTKNFFVNFNLKTLNKIISKIKPEIVIISAANTNIENCEKYKKSTRLLNIELVKKINKLSNIYDFKIIFFSTDQVYKNKELPSKESDMLKPLNYYAKTKILAENCLRYNKKGHLILRTNFFGYGPYYRKSFSDLIIINNKKKKLKYYFEDNIFSPIYLPNFVNILEKLIIKKISGTYNLGSSNYMSKLEFAKYLAKKFKLDLNYIKKGNMKKNINLVKRPLNMSMNNNKILKILRIKIPSIQKQIIQMKKDLFNEYYLFMKNLKIIQK